MSRYSKNIIKEDKQYNIAWGYDYPLNSYFIQEFDEKDDIVFDVDSYRSIKCHPLFPDKYQFSNGEILEVYKIYTDVIPEEHLEALVLDLPF